MSATSRQTNAGAVKRFIRRENLTEDQNLKLLQYLILYVAMGEVDYGGDASKLSLAGIEYGDGEYGMGMF